MKSIQVHQQSAYLNERPPAVNSIWGTGLHWASHLLQPVCRLCGDACTWRAALCPTCVTELAWAKNPCRTCGLDRPENNHSAYQSCGHCLKHSLPWSDLGVPFRYEGSLPWIFHQIKHHQALRLANQLIQLALTQIRLPLPAQTLLIPMPSHPLRVAKRGFSLSLLMAQTLSRHTGQPVTPLLRINHHLKPQKNLARPERFAQMAGAFCIHDRVAHQWMARRPDSPWQEHPLLLIDDVLTTGATLQSAAQCLADAGAHTVAAWLLARTPEK